MNDDDDDCRAQHLACKVDGASPLLLTLTGSCQQMPPPKDVLNIVATVRTKESKVLSVTNKSTVDWDLKPIIEGTYFSGADVLQVPAGSTVSYEVTYNPLTMTSDSSKHLVGRLIPVTYRLHWVYSRNNDSGDEMPWCFSEYICCNQL